MRPKTNNQTFTSANNSILHVLGTVDIPIKLAGRETITTFQIIENLSQDIILGIDFLQRTRAVLDFNCKRITLYNGSVSLPLLTSLDATAAMRTVKRIRVPAHTEV